MTTVTCPCCHAVYAPIGADGVRYFHTCAPLSDAEVGRALKFADDTTTWSADERAQVAAQPRGRSGARDENVDPAKIDAITDPKTGKRKPHVERDVQKAPGADPIST